MHKPRQFVKTVGADCFRPLARENYSPAVQVTESSMMPDFSPVPLFTGNKYTRRVRIKRKVKKLASF